MRLFLDVTRLRQRGRRSTPSGIDRVEYAYLDYALEHGDLRDAQFVVFQGFVEGLIKPERAAALRSAVAASWRLDRKTEDDEVYRVLKAELERPPRAGAAAAMRIEAPPASARWTEIGALAPRDMLRARTRLVRRLDVAGPDAVYLHTSHTQLDRDALPRWLENAYVQPTFFLHDVIPIDAPEFCRPGEDARHKLRLAAMARHGRLVLVNSQATADSARARMLAEGWRTPPFAVVPLGVEACFRSPAALDPPRDPHPYLVVVGTIEPRKNLAFLLAVWRRLVERHGMRAPRLVIVGRRGWENESVLDFLERSHLIAPFVVEASDVSDAGLASVMAGARMVLAPSMSEGFSLPVAEALTLGAPVAASDIEVHREIGQGLARLIDPLDGPGWTRAIEEASGLADDAPTFTPPARAYRSLTWREHVETAFGHIRDHLLRGRATRARPTSALTSTSAPGDLSVTARIALPAATLRSFPWLREALAPDEATTLENPFARPDAVAGWGAKTSAAYARAHASARGLPYITLEDGLYRSVGLGKAGAPSLSFTMDRGGVFFDARAVSDFEALLGGGIDAAVAARGAALRAYVVEKRLSKYNHVAEDPIRLDAPAGLKRILLVDQVAGDRSLIGSGAGPQTFLAMRREAETLARRGAAAVFVRSHPDVVAGYARGMFGALAPPLRLAPEGGPHALLDEVDEVWTASSQLGFDALLRGVPVVVFAAPFYAGWGLTQTRIEAAAPHAAAALARRAAAGALSIDALAGAAIGLFPRYFDPVRRRPIAAEEALARLADWRDRWFARRGPAVVVGFARHKRDLARAHLGAAGAGAIFLRREPPDLLARARAAGARELVAWSDRLSSTAEAAAREAGLAVTRVEDGFLRSRGLGRKRTPPASLCLDARALHFEAARASDLETLLQTHAFTDVERARGARLRETIVSGGVTKYNLREDAPDLRAAARGRRVALVMAQVPGDASLRGGAALFAGNLDFLDAVRAARPDAFVVFKDHPDLVAGLRPGATPRETAARRADLVLTSGDSAALYAQVDEVHVMTSLSGFEALLRGAAVTCWGLPFYAGWGLTTDRIACPRRTRRLALDELVVAAIGRYPSYLDPDSGVPCRAEDVLERLSSS